MKESKKPSAVACIRVGARNSPLSRRQVVEVMGEKEYEPVWIETVGDRDKKTSLRSLDKTDFFTRDLDEALLKGEVDVTVHSAKDLPDPLPEGIELIAVTRGIDPSDSLVLRAGATLQPGMTIATSSPRRDAMVRSLCPDVKVVDIRGNIGERLAKMERGEVDGVVIAEAALIRLELIHLHRIRLPGETAPGQGKLAVLARQGDTAMREMFKDV